MAAHRPMLLGDGMPLSGSGLGLDVREGIELTAARAMESPWYASN